LFHRPGQARANQPAHSCLEYPSSVIRHSESLRSRKKTGICPDDSRKAGNRAHPLFAYIGGSWGPVPKPLRFFALGQWHRIDKRATPEPYPPQRHGREYARPFSCASDHERALYGFPLTERIQKGPKHPYWRVYNSPAMLLAQSGKSPRHDRFGRARIMEVRYNRMSLFFAVFIEPSC